MLVFAPNRVLVVRPKPSAKLGLIAGLMTAVVDVRAGVPGGGIQFVVDTRVIPVGGVEQNVNTGLRSAAANSAERRLAASATAAGQAKAVLLLVSRLIELRSRGSGFG
ncbi:hypothetical protein [Actinoplanes sp. CA-252034]|uniref:hypothetical protein n=1 Tax=Actinoplanes sp. CA-252034 TaxID=3239906 RepID=UPI003D97B7D8